MRGRQKPIAISSFSSLLIPYSCRNKTTDTLSPGSLPHPHMKGYLTSTAPSAAPLVKQGQEGKCHSTLSAFFSHVLQRVTEDWDSSKNASYVWTWLSVSFQELRGASIKSESPISWHANLYPDLARPLKQQLLLAKIKTAVLCWKQPDCISPATLKKFRPLLLYRGSRPSW